MRVLVDVNVMLDVFLDRAPWANESRQVWAANYERRIYGFVAATAVTNLHYIARRHADARIALDCVRRCLALSGIRTIAGRIDARIAAKSLPGSDIRVDENRTLRPDSLDSAARKLDDRRILIVYFHTSHRTKAR